MSEGFQNDNNVGKEEFLCKILSQDRVARFFPMKNKAKNTQTKLEFHKRKDLDMIYARFLKYIKHF